MSTDDATFLAAFEQGALPNSAFHHRDHVRLTWLYLHQYGPEAGARRVTDAVLGFATEHGAADRFHVSLTRFWVELVKHVISAFPATADFDELLAAFPLLADKSTVFRHYSPELLASPAARAQWVEPDLRPLP
jgi:hypothetical protein